MKMPNNPTGILNDYLNRLSIRTHLLLMFGALMLLFIIGSCLMVRGEMDTANKHQADSIGQLLSQQTASASTDMLMTGDRLSLSVLLKQLVENPYIADAAIYSIDNRVIVSASSQKRETTQTNKLYSAPIHYQDVIAGYVKLHLNEALLTQKPNEALNIIIAMGAFLLIIGLIITHLYGSVTAQRLSLIERQLTSILPGTPSSSSNHELDRVAHFVEDQLTDKRIDIQKKNAEVDTGIAAILAIKAKNLNRLTQLLTPKEVQNLLGAYSSIIEQSVAFYEGEVTYTPEGNTFIRFTSDDNPDFSMEALSCALMIEDLVNFVGENSIANIHIGIGLSFSDEFSEFPEEQHPALIDNAASQAFHLARVSNLDGLHLFKSQLSWLPADFIELKVSDFDPEMIKIEGLSQEPAEALKENVMAMMTSL